MSEGTRGEARTEEMERLMEQLSPEGRELWLELEALAAERAPDHRGRIMEIANRIAQLPNEDQGVLDELCDAKERAFIARIEPQQQRETSSSLRWLAQEMQKEGLRRGLDKEERRKMTLEDFMSGEVSESES